MPEYRILYKCRRCGEIDDNTRTGNKNIALHLLINATMGRVEYGIPVAMLSVHSCKDDKGTGIADLIGYEEVAQAQGEG